MEQDRIDLSLPLKVIEGYAKDIVTAVMKDDFMGLFNIIELINANGQKRGIELAEERLNKYFEKEVRYGSDKL